MALPISKIRSREVEEMSGALALQSSIPHIIDQPHSDTLSLASPISLSPTSFTRNSNNGTIDPIHPLQHPQVLKAAQSLLENLEKKEQGTVPSIENLYYSIMLTLCKDVKDLIAIQARIIEGEKEFRDVLHKDFFKIQESLAKKQRTSDVVANITQISGPLALIASGFVAISTGGASLVASAAVALGSLILIDTVVIDDAIKIQLAQWLSQKEEEKVQDWIARIYLFSQLLSFSLSAGISFVNGNDILSLAKTVSGFSLQAIKAGSEISTNRAQALFDELEHALNRSKSTRDNYTTAFSESCKTMEEFHQSMFSVANSLRQTSSLIQG